MNFKLPWKKTSSTIDRLRAAQAQHADANERLPQAQMATTEPIMPVVSHGPDPVASVEKTITPEPRKPSGVSASSEAAHPFDTDERAKALREPLYLANEVLGFELQPEHELLLDELLDHRFQDVLILWPRGSGKTSCIAVAIVRELLRNPNLRISYTTADIDLAERRLRQIADCFDKPTEKFQRLFPEFVGLERRVAREITVKGRSDRALIDASFSVNSILMVTTGAHFDLLILDDIVSEANVISDLSRENNFMRYQLLRGLRSGSARMIVSGTPFHPEDTYGRVRKALETGDEKINWLVDIRDVWRHRCTNCNHKDVFHDEETNSCKQCERDGHHCPNFESGERCVLIDAHKTKSGEIFGFTVEGLLRERGESRMGLANFTRQLEMNAAPEAIIEWPKFTPEFPKVHTVETRVDLGASFLVADLGLRAKPTNLNASPLANLNDPDPTVLMAVALICGQAIPVDCVVGQWDAGDLASVIFKFMQRHHFVPLFSEAIGAWPSIKLNVQQLAGTIKLDLRDIPVSNIPNAKLVRGSQLHSAMTAGKIALYYAMPYADLLCEQLKAFPYPFQGHDDLRDCLGFVPQAQEFLPRASTALLSGGSVVPPSWAGDAVGRSRWEREHQQEPDDGYGSFSY